MGRKLSKKDQRLLGLDQKITRKDFIKSTLIGSGMLLLNMPPPGMARSLFSDPRSQEDWNGYGGVGDYSKSNGNTWEVMSAAHEVRDDLNPGGKKTIDTGEYYDVIIVGGGFSGLGAAYTFQKEAGEQQKCLILENHPIFGGEAKQNEFEVDGHKLYGPQGSNDFLVPPPSSPLFDLWTDLGLPDSFEFVEWNGNYKICKDNYDPMYFNEKVATVGYYFKENDSIVVDPWTDNLERTPWPDELKTAYVRMMGNQEKPNEDEGLEQWLDSITYKQFLVDNLKLDPRVTEFVDPILAVSAYGLGADVISAYGAYSLAMPGINSYRGGNIYEQFELLSFPGGNTGIAKHFVKKLIPDAIPGNSFEVIVNAPVNFSALDKEQNKVRLRLSSTVVEVSHEGEPSGSERVEVVYTRGGKRYRVAAGGVVMASGGWVNRRVVRDLPPEIGDAYDTFNHAPILSVNVALTNWRFLDKLGISAVHWFDDFGFFCNIRKPMIIGGNTAPLDPDKPIVLTFYIPFYYPGLPIKDQGIQGRNYLLGMSYSAIEIKIRERLSMMFSRAGFDPRNDIAGIITNRWGHAFVCPQPGFYFGTNGNKAPRQIIEGGYGRLALAHSELDGHQNWVSAFNHGQRGMRQVLLK